MSPLESLRLAGKLYWKSIFTIAWPLILLPIILINDDPPRRCLYVVSLMAGYWITEAFHHAIVSLMPIVFFPFFDLMTVEEVCHNYMADANMMFVTSLIMAISVEHCHLHERIALIVISGIGCSPKKLHVGMVVITSFISLWISNTATTAIMVPIVASILNELEQAGILSIYEPQEEELSEYSRKPTRATLCYFITAAYATSISGVGTIIGTGTNLAFKGLYEGIFPDAPEIDFGYFMLSSIPYVIVLQTCATFTLQYWYLGLLRPFSADARRINIGKEGSEIARSVIQNRLKELGPMTFHEKAVTTCFIIAVFFWITRAPQAFPGWASMVSSVPIKDSTVAAAVILLMFCIPEKPNFIYTFSSDEDKKPKGPSAGLVTWKIVYKKMSWGLIFLIGCGFSISKAATASKMNDFVIELLGELEHFPPFLIMVASCLAISLINQLTSNVAIANIVLPIMAQLSKNLRIHPLYFMYPACLTCSFAYFLPVSTPPNAIAAAACNMPTIELVKIGIVILFVSLMVLFSIIPTLGSLVWDYEHFPDWADNDYNGTRS